MMMLCVINNATSPVTLGQTEITGNGGFKLFPADRCTWEYEYTNGSYDVTNAEFYPGNGGGIDLNATTRVVKLGYIGKSGRFVEIAN